MGRNNAVEGRERPARAGAFKRAFANFLFSGLSEEERKNYPMSSLPLINICTCMGFVVLFGYSLNYLYVSEQLLKGLFELYFSLCCLLVLLLLRVTKNEQWGAAFLLANSILLVSLLIISGGHGGTGIVWIYYYPLFVFPFQGTRKGVRWMLAIYLALGLVLGLAALGILKMYYPVEFIAKALLSFTLVTLIAYFYEYKMERDTAVLQAEVAERRKVEQELEEANRRLRETIEEVKQKEQQLVKTERLRALGQMASGVAHDFNNTLQPILLSADLLLGDEHILEDRPLLLDCLRRIHTSAQMAGATVQRLVRFYRPGDSQVYLPVVISDLAKDVIEFTRYLWKQEAEAHGVTIEARADCPELCVVNGQLDELREMLVNLVFNAVDAIPKKGSITISCRRAGGQVEVEVRDTGVGMSPEVRAKCMEPFYTTKHKTGSGLGLSVAYGIIKNHHGELIIQSAPGLGTNMIIRLPALTMEGVASRAAPETSAGPPGRPGPGRKRILVVDDESIVLEVLQQILAHEGYDVATAISGAAALDIYRQQPCDLVITDQAMPNMSGLELAEKLKLLAPALPIIMLTGFGELMRGPGAEPPGVAMLLAKPILREPLLAALARVLGQV